MDNREAVVQRRHSRAGRSVQYHEVKDLFRQTYRILVERIDKVMQIFRQSYKETFALYTRNRKKVYIPVTTTQFRGHVTSLAAPKGQRQVSAEIVETGATAISNGDGVFIFPPCHPGIIPFASPGQDLNRLYWKI